MHLDRKSFIVAATVTTAAFLVPVLPAQVEGPQRSHAMVRVEGNQSISANDIQVKVDGREVAVRSLRSVAQDKIPVQLVIAVDEGLRDFGNNLDSLKSFVRSLPPNVSVGVGYMRNGRIAVQGGLTNNHEMVERSVRLPMGSVGMSGSPYFCISDIAKHWPSNERGARFVLMITNGIDPYNGRPTPVNQNSPYVDTAIEDAQRAGVTVYSIFWGMRGGGIGYGSFSGSSYLTDLSESTGGELLSPGTLNPPSIDAFLDRFHKALDRSYLATFDAPSSGKGLQSLKVSSKVHGVKVHAARQIFTGH